MKRNALQLLRLTGKRCVCLGLCVACLFLGGCRAAEEAASDPGAQTDGQAQSVESSEALGTDTPDFAGHGMTMSREEYFSRERYVNWCQSLTCASGSGYGRTVYFPTAQLVLTEAGGVEYKKAAIYEVPAEIQGNISAFLPGEYVFYYQVGNDLYQVFYPESPDCETQKIFSSEKPFFSWFLSNYRMLIGYESQAFQEALARVNGVDEPMPQQYDWYVLDIRSGALQRLPDGKNYSAMTEEERERLFPTKGEESR